MTQKITIATSTYDYIQDPAHGWIVVPLAEITQIGIKGISSYSYRKHGLAYLEEDCDAGLFLRAKEAAGESYTLIDRHLNHDAPCRNFSRFID